MNRLAVRTELGSAIPPTISPTPSDATASATSTGMARARRRLRRSPERWVSEDWSVLKRAANFEGTGVAKKRSNAQPTRGGSGWIHRSDTPGSNFRVPMTAVDWIIIAFVLLMAIWGYAQGLIVGALSLLGFGAGAFIGSRLGPLLLEDGSHSPYAPLSALMGALVI